MTFRKGESGNPAGRPRGIRTPIAQILDARAERDAEEIYAAVKKLAVGDEPDLQAARMILDKVWSAQKERRITIALPPLRTLEDGREALALIAAEAASGNITPAEAEALGRVVSDWIAVASDADVVRRLEEVRQQSKVGGLGVRR